MTTKSAIEWKRKIPGGSWKSIIVAITTSYIETACQHKRGMLWLEEMVAKLTPHHRAYEQTWVKSYFAPDGMINIQPL